MDSEKEELKQEEEKEPQLKNLVILVVKEMSFDVFLLTSGASSMRPRSRANGVPTIYFQVRMPPTPGQLQNPANWT
jgi:hypothetical protein